MEALDGTGVRGTARGRQKAEARLSFPSSSLCEISQQIIYYFLLFAFFSF